MEKLNGEYRLAIQLNMPKSSAAALHLAIGNILKAQGKSDEAIDEYRIAVQLDPISAAAHFGLALLLKEQGKHDEAMSEYRFAVLLDPKLAAIDPWQHWGVWTLGDINKSPALKWKFESKLFSMASLKG